MIPQFVSVRVRSGRRQRFRIWIPVLPVLIVLLPLLVLGIVLVSAVSRVNPIRTFALLWRVLAAARGLRVYVQERNNTIQVAVS